MSDELKQAEQALEDARQARADAEARVEDIEEIIEEREAEADEADRRIREAHEEGVDPRELGELRRTRRTARQEADDLRAERDHLLTIVASRDSAIAEAEIEVHRIRWKLCREKAKELGREVWAHLLEAEQAYREIEALDQSAHRNRSVMRSRGYDGDWWPEPSQAAGLYQGKDWGRLFSELRRLIRDQQDEVPEEDAEAA